MFGLKTRGKLKRELEVVTFGLEQARRRIEDLEKAFDQYTEEPEGCKRGSWCSYCAFSRTVRIPGNPAYLGKYIDVCGKGICGSFKEKN